MTKTTTAQDKSVATVVDGYQRSGHDAIVENQADGTVKVSRSNSDRFAIVGKRGRISWSGPAAKFRGGSDSSICRR